MLTDLINVVAKVASLAWQAYQIAQSTKQLGALFQQISALATQEKAAVETVVTAAFQLQALLDKFKPSSPNDLCMDVAMHARLDTELRHMRTLLETDSKSLQSIVDEFTEMLEKPNSTAEEIASVMILNESKTCDKAKSMLVAIERLVQHLQTFAPQIPRFQVYQSFLSVPINMHMPRKLWFSPSHQMQLSLKSFEVEQLLCKRNAPFVETDDLAPYSSSDLEIRDFSGRRQLLDCAADYDQAVGVISVHEFNMLVFLGISTTS